MTNQQFTVVSPTSCSLTSDVVSLTCWVSSVTAFSWSVDERTRYTHAYRTFLYPADRTKHILAQRSFLFSAGRHKALPNGTLEKRLVGETSGHQTNPTLSTTFLSSGYSLVPCFVCNPNLVPRVSPTRSYGAKERDGWEREPGNEVG